MVNYIFSQNEAMTGTHTQNPVYSRVTLALMEDTGWYRANYDMSQNLSWGSGLGCVFSMKSCKQWMDVQEAKLVIFLKWFMYTLCWFYCNVVATLKKFKCT